MIRTVGSGPNWCKVMSRLFRVHWRDWIRNLRLWAWGIFLECRLDMWDTRDPNSDFLDSWCHWSYFDIYNAYVLDLYLCGRYLIALDPWLVWRVFSSFGRGILDLHEVDDNVDDVVGCDILGVVSDFVESQKRCISSDMYLDLCVNARLVVMSWELNHYWSQSCSLRIVEDLGFIELLKTQLGREVSTPFWIGSKHFVLWVQPFVLLSNIVCLWVHHFVLWYSFVNNHV